MSTSQLEASQLQLEAYKILVGMLQHDDDLFWRRNDVLIGINGGMFTVIGLLHTVQSSASAPAVKAVSIAICVIGAMACILWLLVAKRSEAFYDHWYDQLEYLEKNQLTSIHIFQTADKYFTEGFIEFGGTPVRLDFFSRSLRIFTAIQLIASVFVFVWFFLGMYLLIFG